MNKGLRWLMALGAVLGSMGGIAGLTTASASAAPPCTLFASPSGSDANSGSLSSPFLTPQKLVNSLHAGATGCLRGGSYSEAELSFGHGGSSGAPVTLMSYPGETATLTGGFVYVPSGSDFVTIENLHIDTSAASQVGVQLMASDTSLIGDDITNQSAHESCIILGSNAGWGQAVGTVIQNDVIHQCGSTADGNQDHAIYFDNSTGAVVNNSVIWGTSAYAIHLYQNAQNNQITHNVIVGNGYGVIFAGSSSHTSSGNVVSDNIIADSTVGYDVQSWWGGPVGTGNVLRGNCISAGAGGGVQAPAAGFAAAGNVTASPGFVNAGVHNYQLQVSSPCLSVVGYDTVAAVAGIATSTPTTSTPPAATTPTPTSTTPPATTPTPTSTTPPATTPTPTSTAPTGRGPAPGSPTRGAPAATTSQVTAVGYGAATLNGQVNTGGKATGWYFQYGTTTGYGRWTPRRSLASGSNVTVGYRTYGLSRGTTYHYRLVVTWSDGTSRYGADQHFTIAGAAAAGVGRATARTAHARRVPRRIVRRIVRRAAPTAVGARQG